MGMPYRQASEPTSVGPEMDGDPIAAAALRVDLSGLLEEVARQTVEVSGARRVAVGVVEQPDVMLTVWGVERDGLKPVGRLVVPLNSSGPVAQAVRSRRYTHMTGDSPATGGFAADLAVPMVAGEDVIGVVAVQRPGYETDSPIQLLSRIASRAALALEYVRFRRRSRRALEETITVLAAVVEGRDSYTESHCLHLAEMSLALGVRMGLGQERLDRLNFGGLLHDIGKVSVPDSILAKPGALTDLEYDQMKTHASVGENILARIGSLEDVAPIVGQHHERIDGSGYPRGLQGDDILLEARILAVADTFDAMTTERPYRAALPWSRAVEEISSGSGTLFDPAVVDIFLQYMEGGEAQRGQQRRAPG